MFRHLGLAAAVTFTIFAASPARALDPQAAFEPAVMVHFTFGGVAHPRADLSLKLNYAQDSLATARGMKLPALAEWRVNSCGDDVLALNGLPLHTGNLFANDAAAGAQQQDSGMSPGTRVMLILLGAGGATALVVGAIGHAAEENNPAMSQNQGQVACNQNPVTSTCLVGNGGNGG